MPATGTQETVIAATICKPRPSKYKPGTYFVSVCYRFADESEQWVNYDQGSPELEWLERGHQYQAMATGDTLTLIKPASTSQPVPAPSSQPAPAPAPAPASPAPHAGGGVSDKVALAASLVPDLAALYGHCYGQALVQLEPYQAPDAAIQSAATTIFIQLAKQVGF